VGGLPTKGVVSGFTVERDNAKTMYAAVPEGLFKSTDAGETWKPLTKSPKALVAVAVNPTKPTEIYAVTRDGTIFLSTDGGLGWRRKK